MYSLTEIVDYMEEKKRFNRNYSTAGDLQSHKDLRDHEKVPS